MIRKEQFRFYETLLEITPGNDTPLQVVNEIDALIHKARTEVNSSENLSRSLVVLADKNNDLGALLHEAQTEEGEAEKEYKYLVDKSKLAYVKGGDSATVAESKAKLDHKDALDTWYSWKKNTSLLRIKRESVETFLRMSQSRNSTINKDVHHANF